MQRSVLGDEVIGRAWGRARDVVRGVLQPRIVIGVVNTIGVVGRLPGRVGSCVL